MIKTNTVLILGAGASWDYGFPVGEKLRNQICKGIWEFDPYLEQKWNRDVLLPFAHTLLESRISVDAFLEEHPDYLDMGKFAIASKLLPLEKERLLYDAWLYPEKVKGKNHWYDILFEKLIDEVDFDNFKDNELSVITFNYDRSFEQFLFKSFRSSRKKAKEKENEADCIRQVNSIEVVHVYGSLGRLPWQSDSGLLKDVPEVKYDALEDGGALSPKITTIARAANCIDLVREGSGDTPAFARAKELLQQAQRIYILGFGFNMTNLERLGLLDPDFRTVVIQGTAYDLSAQSSTGIKQIKYVESIEEPPPRKYREKRFDLYGQTVHEFLYKNPNGYLD